MATIEKINQEFCTGCAACMNICPIQAIQMVKNQEGFFFPKVNINLCVNCGRCYKTCPLNHHECNSIHRCLAAYARDPAIHKTSSSGGVFYLLARNTLNKGGIVYGAAFNQCKEVSHARVETFEELEKLRGSKYVQSNIGYCYISVKEDLDHGFPVLFSGTPCQIGGLKSFLGKDYSNLVCVEVICHGVASQDVLSAYVNQKFSGRKPDYICFRNKDLGIDHNRIEFVFQNEHIIEGTKDNSYMKGYLKNYFTRMSCFNCTFKSRNSVADITLGDFWSAKEFHPDMDCKFGVSAIITRSSKGQDAINATKPDMVWKEAEFCEIAVWNESLVKSPQFPKEREAFFENWRSEQFERLVNDLAERELRDNPSVPIIKSKIWQWVYKYWRTK